HGAGTSPPPPAAPTTPAGPPPTAASPTAHPRTPAPPWPSPPGEDDDLPVTAEMPVVDDVVDDLGPVPPVLARPPMAPDPGPLPGAARRRGPDADGPGGLGAAVRGLSGEISARSRSAPRSAREVLDLGATSRAPGVCAPLTPAN